MSAHSNEVVPVVAAPPRSPLRNPAFLAMIGLPAFAILASLGMTSVAYLRGDPELPQEYHWEGSQLDADFAAARRAAELDVRASLQFLPAAGMCRLALRLDAAPPAALTLALIHESRPELDQHVRLLEHAGFYEGPCRIASVGSWRVDLADEPLTWRVRQELVSLSPGFSLSARAQ